MRSLNSLFLFFGIAFASSAWAANKFPSFTKSNGDKVVFADFKTANYKLNYDFYTSSLTYKAEIVFHLDEPGYMAFDLITDPLSLNLDGESVSSQVISTPSNETKIRVLNQALSAGEYLLQVSGKIDKLVKFDSSGVSSAFWVTDLDDRSFLETYIPVSFEYDQVKMRFEVSFNGLTNDQIVFSNGVQQSLPGNQFQIDYPDYFTVSSIYFHTLPRDSFKSHEFIYSSQLSGRKIPVQVYTKNFNIDFNRYEQKILSAMAELETDYGDYPHSSFLVYDADLSQWGLGGMEYCGSTVTGIRAVEHELFHSFFGRGVFSANGNSGWIDEALASWRDSGYPRLNNMSGSSKMAAHPGYTRFTDRLAYSFGARFISHLDYLIADAGGMKAFMREFLAKNKFIPITTEQFISDFEAFNGKSFSRVFEQFVYGKTLVDMAPLSDDADDNKSHSFHKKANPDQLYQIL